MNKVIYYHFSFNVIDRFNFKRKKILINIHIENFGEGDRAIITEEEY